MILEKNIKIENNCVIFNKLKDLLNIWIYKLMKI